MENIPHLGYRLEIKKWRLKTEREKAIGRKENKKMQRKFRRKLELVIDVRKQGSGTILTMVIQPEFVLPTLKSVPKSLKLMRV